MKKLLFALLVCIASLTSFAQVHYDGPWTTSAQFTCFCCDPNFSLPTNPPIYTNFIHGTGTTPDTLSCIGTNSLSTLECSSAKYNWTVSPGLTFNGQGTSKIDLVSASVAGTTYTICVTISCGNKSVKACKQVYSKECCNCAGLPQSFNITGPQFYCISKPCNQIFSYNAPNFGGKPCFSYEWFVTNPNGGTITVGGQGTNTIDFPCSTITTPGSYTITLIIKCGTKMVKSTITLVACSKPDPSFNQSSSGTNYVLTPFDGSTHLWYIVDDTDKSCSYTAGEKFEGPISSGGLATLTLPTTSAFGPLVYNQSYIIYHIAYNDCGNGKQQCMRIQDVCVRWSPPSLKVAPGSKGDVKIESKSILESMKELPKELREKLPAYLKKIEQD